MTVTLPCPLGCVHAHMHRLMHWRNANGIYGCNQSGSGWSDQDQATEDASLVSCPPCLTEVEAMRAERDRKIADAKARKAFLPPPDSAINVHDIEAMGSHGFAYQAGAARFTLIAASADGGQVTATWSRGGASGFARALTARLAIRQALATFDDLALSVDVERALLSRKTEYVWRGPITEGRVEHDYAVAVTLNGLGADAAYWAAPGATDWAHGEALFMEFERAQDEASAINVRLGALAVAQDAELARFGINIYDVEGLGYEALHLMRAEAVELDVLRDEVARHLSGAELDAAVLRYARDLEARPRCVACLCLDEAHPVDCLLHPAAIEAAVARVLATKTLADLDANAR